ncbi:MAG: MerR family DNA-binding transcriptional regulator [Rhizobiaceae bacterium]|jgi:DNA-binding transcriptional MerR regulator
MTLLASAGVEPTAHNELVSENADDRDAFFRIGDLARQFGVSLRTLRFYEDKGLLNPKRDGVTRLYTRRDKTRLQLILLGRRVGFSLRDVKQMIDLYDPSGTNARQLRLTLEKSEKQLTRLHKQRQSVDEAIEELSALVAQLRERLAGNGTARLAS